MIKKLLPWTNSILFITSIVLAVYCNGYAPVAGFGTAGANINTCVISKYYSGCETHAARFVRSFSSGSQPYCASCNPDLSQEATTHKIFDLLPGSLACSGTVGEFKAGPFSRNSNPKNTNPIRKLTGKNIAFEIPDPKYRAIPIAGGPNIKTDKTEKINIAYIRYAPVGSIKGNREAVARVRGVGKYSFSNTGQCTVPLKTHTLTPGKYAWQTKTFDFTVDGGSCQVLSFCA